MPGAVFLSPASQDAATSERICGSWDARMRGPIKACT
jgi:hypothetical protein